MIPESSMRVYLALGSTDMRKAINGLSLYVFEGELRAVVGPNGAGKTTLAKEIEVHQPALRLCPDEWISQILADPADAELDARHVAGHVHHALGADPDDRAVHQPAARFQLLPDRSVDRHDAAALAQPGLDTPDPGQGP